MTDKRKMQKKRMAGRRRRRRRRLRRCLVCVFALLLVCLFLLTRSQAGDRFLSGFLSLYGKHLELDGISSTHAILIEKKTGRTVGETLADETVYPASLTKIMTAVVAIENLKDLQQEITLDPAIFPDLYAQNAMRAGFEPGETVRAIDLLYGVLLPSGAECCISLAQAVSGSEDAFVEQMNQKAQKLGMKNTHFCDSTGLHDPEHYSTCRDLAVLLRYALKNETFRKIIESHWHSTPGTNIHPDGITYYSTMFKGLADAAVTGGEILGGKTGYTSEAGYCLASFARIENREYILVTTGSYVSGGHIQDAVTIYNRVAQKDS